MLIRSLKGIGKLDGALSKLVLPSSSYNTVLYAVSETSLWHSRLGHPSFHVLNKMPNLVCTTRDCPQAPCDICHFAKQSRSSFPLSTSCTTKIFELLHYDVWGPYKHKTHDGSSYFLTLVDDFSRCTMELLNAL